MGWGEPMGQSAQMTAKAELARLQTALADAVDEYRRKRTTDSVERMWTALDLVGDAQRKVWSR